MLRSEDVGIVVVAAAAVVAVVCEIFPLPPPPRFRRLLAGRLKRASENDNNDGKSGF